MHRWQAVADALRQFAIDIDFRRARDRTALLLDQWREKGLKRPSSGNPEDHAEQERLLAQISPLELAAKPRDSMSDGRSRDHSARITSKQESASATPSTSVADNPPDQGALDVIASADPRPGKISAFAGCPSTQGHVPPLLQNHDSVLPQTRGEPDLQGLPFGSNPTQPPEKLLKNSQGKRRSPRFSQSLLLSPSATLNSMPLVPQPIERRSPQRGDAAPYRTDLPLFRTALPYRGGSASNLGSAPLDASAVHAVPSSPRIGEGQNIQLDPLPSSLSRPPSENDMAQLRRHLLKLEHILSEEIHMSHRRLKYEERRLVWDRDREAKRLALEKERIDKEYEDRKQERQERLRREERYNEDRERILKILVRNQNPQLRDRDDPE